MSKTSDSLSKVSKFSKITFFEEDSLFQYELLECLYLRETPEQFAETVKLLNRFYTSPAHVAMTVKTKQYNISERARKGEKIFYPLCDEANRLSQNIKRLPIETPEMDKTMGWVLLVFKNLFESIRESDFTFIATLATLALYRRSENKSLLKDSNAYLPEVFVLAKNIIFADKDENKRLLYLIENPIQENVKQISYFMIALTLEMFIKIYELKLLEQKAGVNAANQFPAMN